MDSSMYPELHVLGQPRLTSIYDETGTPASGYGENGPYHCEDCIHKTAHDEPFCIHPKVIADPDLQDRLVMINNRPAIKICLDRGCCRFVNQPVPEKDEDDHGEHES